MRCRCRLSGSTRWRILWPERLKLTWISASSPWLDRKAAADYLGVPISRVEKDRTLPCHRWEGRVLYHRDELDGWLLEKGAR
jgi:hypothetical protein